LDYNSLCIKRWLNLFVAPVLLFETSNLYFSTFMNFLDSNLAKRVMDMNDSVLVRGNCNKFVVVWF
jgi:hypothetical protein